MPAYKTGKRTQQYSLEFKVKAVLWSHEPRRSSKDVAESLDIHLFMLSRWRKEYRVLVDPHKLVRDFKTAPTERNAP